MAEKKISYFQKEATVCPVCSKEFHREEMLTGGGRLIAGKLSDELRRLYEKNQKFGVIYPLAYVVTVCPRCLYASYPRDFGALAPAETEKMRESAPARQASIKKFFGDISFENERNLILGAASFLLAVDCYTFRGKNVAPTFKRAVSSIRAAWLFNDLAAEMPERPYKRVSDFFYQKAYQFYVQLLEIAQTGAEPLDAAGNMGPDTDKNWGYEGILYMNAILTVKVGILEKDIAKRIENFERTKRYLSRLFGSGKASKSKPGLLIDMTRDLYDKMNELLNQWKEETGQGQGEPG
ncbi:MAG TPA: DUF2225 domain-containing protein [Spirochaetes bacterium]|nr:DUF2225 domain-containing protein [Spirochaetota bacterium]